MALLPPLAAQERTVQHRPYIDERRFHYGFLFGLHDQGLGISAATLEDLSSDEASHVAMVVSSHTGPINEQAFRDYVDIIHARCRKRSVSSDEDLLALRNRKKESGGYHG